MSTMKQSIKKIPVKCLGIKFNVIMTTNKEHALIRVQVYRPTTRWSILTTECTWVNYRANSKATWVTLKCVSKLQL